MKILIQFTVHFHRLCLNSIQKVIWYYFFLPEYSKHYSITFVSRKFNWKKWFNIFNFAVFIQQNNLNQIVPSIFIMIELCYLPLNQWEIKIHLLWGICFNTPRWPRSHSTNRRLQHIGELTKSLITFTLI